MPKLTRVATSRAILHARTTPRAAATTYTCPMHPDVGSGVPGECPKCGMKLVPVK